MKKIMDELNALKFSIRREQKQCFKQFLSVLELFIFCYKEKLKQEDVVSLSKIRKETGISPENYLKYQFVKDYVRKYKQLFPTIAHLNFLYETGEYDPGKEKEAFNDIAVYSIHVGRTWKLSGSFDDEDYYFSFECKRLNDAGKNQLYIDQGIKRYVENTYAGAMPFAGMIGFIEQGDIVRIKDDINLRLSKLNKSGQLMTIEFLRFFKVEENFQFSFSSKHERVCNSPIALHHLFLDYSSILI
ncbi:MAG: hypothetical protein MUF15_01645 [Acidobacteria bacterium]|jgi:hypothetical protein|nr:hypothetical protein [Acidobacteriota bacterium]